MAVPDTYQDEFREERMCAGCGNSVESADLRQLVVSFGNALWHPECFRCAKCSKLVDGGSSLLLLSDGNPLCSDCTFTCGVCHKSIIDEAITTGSDAYHADCFKCRACREPIQEVVFAKTRDAVFCMACHNVRIARSRKKQEMRARNREGGGDSHHRSSHRDRSREGHSSGRKEKDAAPPVPLAPIRTNSSPPPEGDSILADSPVPTQSDVTSGAKRMSIIQSQAQGIPAPPLSPRKQSYNTSGRLHPSSTTGTFASESYSRNSLSPSTSPRNSGFTTNNDSLSPMWQQSQHKERHHSTNSPRSSMIPQTPTQNRKEGRRSFNPLDAIIDGMERPYTPRTKNVGTNALGSSSGNHHYEDTSGDGIPDALKEYFQEVVEIEPAPRRSAPAPNGLLAQPRSFFDTPSPSIGLSSANPSVQPTPEPPSYRSSRKSVPQGVTPAPSDTESHVKNAPSMSSSRRQFEAYDGVEEEEISQPPQKQNSTDGLVISPQAWMGSPSRSRPVTANRETGNNSIFSQFSKLQGTATATSTTTSPTLATHSESPLKTPTDPHGRMPTTPTTPLTADGVIRPPPASIPRGVTSEEGESTETESEITSPIVVGIDGEKNLVPSPAQLPMRELPEEISPATITNETSGLLGSGNSSPVQSRPVASNSEVHHDNQVSVNVSSAPSSTSPGIKKKRKHDEKAPALPPIRISQFYVESPEGVKGSIEVSQGIDDSTSSSEGNNSFLEIENKEGAVLDSVIEETEDHYVMVTSESGKPKEDDTTIMGRKVSENLERRSSNDRWTPTVVIDSDNHRRSEDTSGTSEQSHESSVTMISQTNESIETMIPEQNLSVGTRALKRAQLKADIRPPTAAPGEEVYDVVLTSLNDLIENATKHNKSVVKLDLKFVEVIRKTLVGERNRFEDTKGKFDASKRESFQFAAGLSVEFDRELASRRDAQTEVRRLRVLVQEQAAKLSALAGEQRKRDILEKNSKEISTNLVGLEKDLSKLKVERDMTMAEVAELSGSKSGPTSLDNTSVEAAGARLSKALSVRFDGIKSQYKRQLEPLTEQREALLREIEQLSESRKAILEETAALHARNEELFGLNTQLVRNIENKTFQQSYAEAPPYDQPPSPTPPPPPPSSTKVFSASTGSNMSYTEESNRTLRARPSELAENVRGGLFKRSRNRDVTTPSRGDSNSSSPMTNGFQKAIKFIPHSFTQMALLRVARCDHCNDKMWGTQSRCHACAISVHPRCANHLKTSCPGTQTREDGMGTVFGRDLIEQVKLDAGDTARLIPVIVEKCIQAIEIDAIDYEGLYRKSGGSGQIKTIEALFEKGHYEAIDLLDPNITSDISSVTSVLKSYFRELPNPLMTTALHEPFMEALMLKDLNAKLDAVATLLRQLPREHYETLKFLMQHLYQVQARKSENRMDSKNLGLVFGPTLMRSADVTREFGDMAGKTQMVELLVDHAPSIFRS